MVSAVRVMLSCVQKSQHVTRALSSLHTSQTTQNNRTGHTGSATKTNRLKGCSYHSPAGDRPVEFLILGIESEKLQVFQVSGEEGPQRCAIHVSACNLGRNPTVSSLVRPVQFPMNMKNTDSQ